MSDAVKKIVGPTILLFGGAYFDFENPEGSDFSIEDIAHGLSMTCRFVGQCQRFYSVAQHSVHVSEIVPPQDALAGLMHDAAEAFIGDVSKPLKGMLPEYKAIERRVELAIFNRYGIVNIPDSVKEADRVMLSTEQQQLMRNQDEWSDRRPPLVFAIPNWSADEAKAQFLDRFQELLGRMT